MKILKAAGYPNPEAAAKALRGRAEVLEDAARELFEGGLLRPGASLDRAARLDPPTADPELSGAAPLRVTRRIDHAREPTLDLLPRAA